MCGRQGTGRWWKRGESGHSSLGLAAVPRLRDSPKAEEAKLLSRRKLVLAFLCGTLEGLRRPAEPSSKSAVGCIYRDLLFPHTPMPRPRAAAHSIISKRACHSKRSRKELGTIPGFDKKWGRRGKKKKQNKTKKRMWLWIWWLKHGVYLILICEQSPFGIFGFALDKRSTNPLVKQKERYRHTAPHTAKNVYWCYRNPSFFTIFPVSSDTEIKKLYLMPTLYRASYKVVHALSHLNFTMISWDRGFIPIVHMK